MDKISNVTLSTYTKSDFVQPFRMHYTQNNVEKTWDLIKVHKSVVIIVFNVTRKVLIFVKQFRPAVYYNGIPEEDRQSAIDSSRYPGHLGLTIELCAGIVDKNIPLEEIAQEEILEECGYQVPLKNIERIISYRSGVGVSGDQQTLFYAEVTEDMKVSDGGGLASEGELIEVVEMTITEAQKYLQQKDVYSPGAFLFGITWFLHNKKERYS